MSWSNDSEKSVYPVKSSHSDRGAEAAIPVYMSLLFSPPGHILLSYGSQCSAHSFVTHMSFVMAGRGVSRVSGN